MVKGRYVVTVLVCWYVAMVISSRVAMEDEDECCKEVTTESCRGNVAMVKSNVAVECRYEIGAMEVSRTYTQVKTQEGGKSVS